LHADAISTRTRGLAAPHGDRVRFIPILRGYVEQVPSAADVARFAPSPTEGSPRAVVMAQLARRPVVATSPEGTEDVVVAGYRHGHFPSNDPLALARVLPQYRDQPERRDREGRRGREYAFRPYDRRRVEEGFEENLRRPDSR
jgi:glycosyltransferase involved in cell wall biosynthesis